jgi:hypothetical protein
MAEVPHNERLRCTPNSSLLGAVEPHIRWAACCAAEMIRASSRGDVPMANKDRTIKSRLTERSPASILATRD